MKPFTKLALLFLILFVYSCSLNIKNDLVTLRVKGNVKSISENGSVEKIGEVQKGERVFRGSDNYLIVFNKTGNKKKEEAYFPDGKRQWPMTFNIMIKDIALNKIGTMKTIVWI